MSKHVATPVRVSNIASGFEIDDALGRPLAQVFERYSKSNDERREVCAHIVRCVNNFDALVEALEIVTTDFASFVDWSEVNPSIDRGIRKARAALSAARSEP